MKKKIKKTRTIVIKIPYEKIRGHLHSLLKANKIFPSKVWILWEGRKCYYHVKFKNCSDRKKFERKWLEVYAKKIENAKPYKVSDLSVFVNDCKSANIDKVNEIIKQITIEEDCIITNDVITLMSTKQFKKNYFDNYFVDEELLINFRNDYYKAEFLIRMSTKNEI